MLARHPNRFLDLQLTLRDICKAKRQIVNKGRCSTMHAILAAVWQMSLVSENNVKAFKSKLLEQMSSAAGKPKNQYIALIDSEVESCLC